MSAKRIDYLMYFCIFHTYVYPCVNKIIIIHLCFPCVSMHRCMHYHASNVLSIFM